MNVVTDEFNSEPADNWSVEKYFAREGVDPLPHAFSGKIAVHPGVSSGAVSRDSIQETLSFLTENPRLQDTVAYIHVPFCQTHCLYCGFYNKGYNKEESRRYADTLIREMRLWEKKRIMQDDPVHAVYFGGGTPTALESEDLARLLEAVRTHLPLANDCEITVEGRLYNFDERKMEACFRGGANRFSIGVQSFSTKIRQAMGRLVSREEAVKQLELLLSYRQAAVIVDLIFGFPMQTMDIWLDDIAAAKSLNLDGMDCYQLNVYGQTPLGKAIKEGRMEPAADIPLQSAMFKNAVETLTSSFYRRLSLTHWARTSRERNLYNLKVKGRAECLAFGPGAGGNLGGWFYMNQPDYEKWQTAVHEGVKPVMALSKPNPHYYFYRHVGEAMEQGWVDFSDLEKRYRVEVQQALKPVVGQWQRAGLVEMRGSVMVLTVAGQFWQVNLSHLLQDYLKHTLESEEK